MNMNFTLERIAQPEIEPVTLAEIIQHVREFSSISVESQTELTKLIVGGREWAEDYSGRALIDQTWRLTLSDVASDSLSRTGYYQGTWNWIRRNEILLRKSPVLSILSVASVGPTGAETVANSSTYEVREAKSKWPRIFALNSAWTSADLRITFRAGFADRDGSPQQGAEMVPEVFKQAIKLWVEAHYDRDKDMMKKLLDAAAAVLKPERAEMSLA